MATFTFRKQAMVDLWNEELLGQISDGMWENSRSAGADGGWKHYTNATQGENKVVGYIPRSFQFSELIPFVGDRMLLKVQKSEPGATMEDVQKYCQEISSVLTQKLGGIAKMTITTVVATVPGKHGIYEIRFSNTEGKYYCSCPGWRFSLKRTGVHTCKHLEAFFRGEVEDEGEKE
ncbi:MAG: hypothetical protein UV64_C0007G0034 [Parcubacteria group bacterium GW2011_GWC1_43_11b]|nr:MAG: hypothetical protein UV64_C0007G0034 [Parcubacteria group bacterium GW2011_GWC1_43_11b]